MTLRRLLRPATALLATLFGALCVIVTALPARWADPVLARATHGRVRLAQAQGSIWDGSARLVLSPGEENGRAQPGSGGFGADDRVLGGVAVPGRISWTIGRLPLLLGRLDLQLRVDAAMRPVRAYGSGHEVRIDPGTIELPAVELARLGSPWNTVRPAGALSVGWDNIVVREQGFDGRAWIELRNASSSLTPVRPLGSYRVDVTGAGGRVELRMKTIDGPLQLQGSGDFDPVRGLHFVAGASAREPEKERLQSFLGLLGPRRGESTIIRIGA